MGRAYFPSKCCLHFSYVQTPPPFHKHESRFEREQKIRVGSVDAYKPGENQIDVDRLVHDL